MNEQKKMSPEAKALSIVAGGLVVAFLIGRKSVRIPVIPTPPFPESATLLGQAVIITMSDGVRYFADFAESDWTFAQKLGSAVGKK